MDNVIEEFKSELSSVNKEEISQNIEDNSLDSTIEMPKTFNDILNENSNNADIEVLEAKKDNIDVSKLSNENNITDDQYFDDFFQDE